MNGNPVQQQIFNDVLSEAYKQDYDWGLLEDQGRTLMEWGCILGEEYGELCQELLRGHFGPSLPANAREEAIQIMTVAMRIIESIDKGLLA